MNKFLDKFGIFDIFSMLIPGILTLGTFVFFFSGEFPMLEGDWGFKEYGIFFAMAYLLGLLLYELGAILDDRIYDKLLYGDDPSKIYYSEPKQEESSESSQGMGSSNTDAPFIKKIRKIVGIKPVNVICNECTQVLIKDIRNKMCAEYGFGQKKEENINDMVYQTCVAALEIKGFNGKIDKMLTISELSRSMVTGFLIMLVLLLLYAANGILITNDLQLIATLRNIIISCVAMRIFWSSKRRYEQHRYAIVFRTYAVVYGIGR